VDSAGTQFLIYFTSFIDFFFLEDDSLDYKPLGMGFVTFQSKRTASLCANSVNGPKSGQW
jgi:hypothetical protein